MGPVVKRSESYGGISVKHLAYVVLGLSVFALSACGTPATDEAVPTATSESKVVSPTHSDVSYIQDGDPKHTLDIYLPEAAQGPSKTVFFIHGDGDTKEDHIGVGSYLAERGYAAVLTEYRYPNEPDRPYMLQDVFCSLAWVHANADTYGFDTNRIVAFGFSLGGLIAADVGAVDDPASLMADCPHQLPGMPLVNGVATYAGLLGTPEVCLQASWCMSGAATGNSIPLPQMVPIFEALRAVPASDWRDGNQLSAEAASFARTLPAFWIDGSEPEYLLIHGSSDDRIPPAESEALASRLQSAGVTTELVLLPTAGHQSIYPASPSFEIILEAVESFLAGP
jgi:acetyl esterase/lipase